MQNKINKKHQQLYLDFPAVDQAVLPILDLCLPFILSCVNFTAKPVSS